MKPWILLYLLLASLTAKAYASRDYSIDQLKDGIKKIEIQDCPEGEYLENRHWVKKRLACLAKIDQYVRVNCRGCLNNPAYSSFLKDVDQRLTIELKKILKRYGWINISIFGKKADQNAWLLVQHSSDLEFQSSILFILNHLVLINETNKSNYAYLYDRVSLSYKQFKFKQKYGTQLVATSKGFNLEPFEGTLEELNNRRAQMNLESVKQYLENVNHYNN